MPLPIAVDLDCQSSTRLRNLPDPLLSGDATNKSWVENAIAVAVGDLAFKDNVAAVATTNININSPGSTFDGVAMTASYPRLLLISQTDATQNGIWLWTAAATALTRAPDANTWDELRGARVTADAGTLYGGVRFYQSTLTGTLGTTAVTWAVDTSSVPAATTTQQGASRHATQQEVDAGVALSPNPVVTPVTLAGWSGRRRELSQPVGDGTSLQFVISHNWNTYNFHAVAYRATGTRGNVVCQFERQTINSVTVIFEGTPPAANSIQVYLST